MADQIVPQPVCPHCLADPCNFTVAPVNFGQMCTIVIFCGNQDCRKVFGVSFIGAQQKQIVVPGIQLPNRVS